MRPGPNRSDMTEMLLKKDGKSQGMHPVICIGVFDTFFRPTNETYGSYEIVAKMPTNTSYETCEMIYNLQILTIKN